MRVLVYGINFSPELTGIGKYTSEMSHWLARQGHQVRAVVAPPYYPQWKVWEGYSGLAYRVESGGRVKVYRCPLWIPRTPWGLARIAHLCSFAFSSLPVVLWQASVWRPDLVWLVEPPLLCAPAGLVAGWIARAKTWLHVQDFEVHAAARLGMLGLGALHRAAAWLESWLMRRFDVVSTISRRMLERLASQGVKPSRCILFPNWVDTDSIYPLRHESPLRRELDLPPGTIVALYAGTLNEKQGLHLLLEVASLLHNERAIKFVVCGDGPWRHRLQEAAERLENVQLLPLQPVSRLNDLLNLADIHLLPQQADVADLVLPSKLAGMLASGRPVVTTARLDTELGELITQCGRVVPPGDAEAMSHAVRELARQPDERAKLGVVARQVALTRWACSTVLSALEKAMRELSDGTLPTRTDLR